MSDRPFIRGLDDQDISDLAEPILELGHGFEPILIDDSSDAGFPALDLP
jgi:hypothetical protein